MSECTSAKICGLVDRHASEKKTLQDLGKRKQKVDGELVALKSELHVKKSTSDGIEQSFESKLHDIVIRSNPEKYLTINRRPKEGVKLADSYIIKKYYGSKSVDKETMERDSEMYQTIIKSTEERFNVKREKNSVIMELQRRGIQWPTAAVTSPLPSVVTPSLPSMMQIPWMQSTPVSQQDSSSVAAMYALAGLSNSYDGYGRSVPSDASNRSSNNRTAVASPPPPPLPDDDDQYGYVNSTGDSNN